MQRFKHCVDLVDFLEREADIIQQYFEEITDSDHDPASNVEWIYEHILQLFTKWATGITTTMIRQDVLNEMKTFFLHNNTSSLKT